MQKTGKVLEYKSNNGFKKIVKLFIALSFVPAEYFVSMYYKLLEYVENEY
jgi:hypothetical protein